MMIDNRENDLKYTNCNDPITIKTDIEKIPQMIGKKRHSYNLRKVQKEHDY